MVDLDEFLMASIDINVFTNETWLREAFDTFDKDGDGDINPEELKLLLFSHDDGTVCQSVIDAAMDEFTGLFEDEN